VPQGEASLVIGRFRQRQEHALSHPRGLLAPSAGQRDGRGEDLALVARERDRSAHAHRHRPQTLHLIGVLDVRENLRLARDLAGLPPTTARRRASARASASQRSRGRRRSRSRWARRSAWRSRAPS
jgi:hypothetical protein